MEFYKYDIPSSSIATLAKAETLVKKMWSNGFNCYINYPLPLYYEQNPRNYEMELMQVGNSDWRLDLNRKKNGQD